jgi:hypothetical protein
MSLLITTSSSVVRPHAYYWMKTNPPMHCQSVDRSAELRMDHRFLRHGMTHPLSYGHHRFSSKQAVTERAKDGNPLPPRLSIKSPMRPCILLILALFLHRLAPASETRDLLLVAGQSNAVGFDARAEELPPETQDAQTLFWWRVGDPPPDSFDSTSARHWTHLQFQPRTAAMPEQNGKKLPRQYGNFNTSSRGGFGPEIGLVRTLAKKESRPLAVIKTAFSGTSVAGDWNVALPGTADSCYSAMREEILAALAAAKDQGIQLRPRAFIWIQGESDANPKNAPDYAANLTKMLTRLRADLGTQDLVLLLGVNTRFGNGKNPFIQHIVDAQKQIAATLPYTRYVDTTGAETLPPSHTHFTATGTLEIGRRYAETLLEIEKPK